MSVKTYPRHSDCYLTMRHYNSSSATIALHHIHWAKNSNWIVWKLHAALKATTLLSLFFEWRILQCKFFQVLWCLKLAVILDFIQNTSRSPFLIENQLGWIVTVSFHSLISLNFESTHCKSTHVTGRDLPEAVQNSWKRYFWVCTMMQVSF